MHPHPIGVACTVTAFQRVQCAKAEGEGKNSLLAKPAKHCLRQMIKVIISRDNSC